jgi:hypothetical protein
MLADGFPGRPDRPRVMPSPSNNRAWLTALASAGVSLCLGALSLWLILPLVDGRPAGAGGSMAMKVSDFEPVPAAAVLRDVPAAERPSPARLSMMLTAAPSIEAAQFPLLEVDVSMTDSESRLYLFWRRADRPDTLFSLLLDGAGVGTSWHEPALHAEWRGTIEQLAIAGFGAGRAFVPDLGGLRLHGGGRGARVAQLRWYWTRFEPWQMSTINKVPGARSGAPLSPTSAALTWALLSMLFLTLCYGLLRGPRKPWLVAALAVVFVPWIGLDRLWQARLDWQLELTESRFGGLTQAEKHSRELDSDLQRFASRVAERVPAGPEHRVFLLHDSKGHNFWRLRLQYHLLPRNIHNFGRGLPVLQLEAGDFILVLHDIAGLRFDRSEGTLSDQHGSVPVERLLLRPGGALYRVRSASVLEEV